MSTPNQPAGSPLTALATQQETDDQMSSDPRREQSPTVEPRCIFCGDPPSKHTKKAADWRTVPGCVGHYTTAPLAGGDDNSHRLLDEAPKP